jgi:hypothetical protein
MFTPGSENRMGKGGPTQYSEYDRVEDAFEVARNLSVPVILGVSTASGAFRDWQ